MAPVNALTWTTYYAQSREDDGSIQSLFKEDLQDLLEKTSRHFEEPGNKFADLIAGSASANMIMLVPGRKGYMNLLHHGFVSSSCDGLALIFIQSDLSDCAYVTQGPEPYGSQCHHPSSRDREKEDHYPKLPIPSN